MARKRMIDPDFWSDESLGAVDRTTRLLFMGLISQADDEGRLRGNPALIRSVVLPYDDDITTEDVRKSLVGLHDRGLIQCYRKDNQQFIWIINFAKHQTINKPTPSKLPPPLAHKDSETEATTEPLQEDYGTPTVVLPPNRREEKRREEKGTEPDALARARPVLRDFGITDEQVDRSIELAGPDDTDDLPFMAESFIEYHRAKNTRVKSPYRSWLTWLKKDREFRDRDAPVPSGRSPTNGMLVNDTDGWLEQQWEEARKHG